MRGCASPAVFVRRARLKLRRETTNNIDSQSASWPNLRRVCRLVGSSNGAADSLPKVSVSVRVRLSFPPLTRAIVRVLALVSKTNPSIEPGCQRMSPNPRAEGAKILFEGADSTVENSLRRFLLHFHFNASPLITVPCDCESGNWSFGEQMSHRWKRLRGLDWDRARSGDEMGSKLESLRESGGGMVRR